MSQHKECLQKMHRAEFKRTLQESKTIRRMNAIQNPKVRAAMKLLYSPIAIVKNEGNIRTLLKESARSRSKSYFPYLEMCISSKCTLRCKYCSNLMPCYEDPQDISVDVLKESFDRLMSICDKVSMFQILGGETFLCKNLPEILEYVLRYPQIKEISIPTNGTIMIRDEQLLELMKNPRVIVNVSDYGFGHPAELCAFLKSKGIRVRQMPEEWKDYGNTEKRNRSRTELTRQFAECGMVCKSLLNGKLFACPRSSHGNATGCIPAASGDFLDFLDEGSPVTKQQLIDFYYRDEPVAACDHCDHGTMVEKAVPAGRDQLPKI